MSLESLSSNLCKPLTKTSTMLNKKIKLFFLPILKLFLFTFFIYFNFLSFILADTGYIDVELPIGPIKISPSYSYSQIPEKSKLTSYGIPATTIEIALEKKQILVRTDVSIPIEKNKTYLIYSNDIFKGEFLPKLITIEENKKLIRGQYYGQPLSRFERITLFPTLNHGFTHTQIYIPNLPPKIEKYNFHLVSEVKDSPPVKPNNLEIIKLAKEKLEESKNKIEIEEMHPQKSELINKEFKPTHSGIKYVRFSSFREKELFEKIDKKINELEIKVTKKLDELSTDLEKSFKDKFSFFDDKLKQLEEEEIKTYKTKTTFENGEYDEPKPLKMQRIIKRETSPTLADFEKRSFLAKIQYTPDVDYAHSSGELLWGISKNFGGGVNYLHSSYSDAFSVFFIRRVPFNLLSHDNIHLSILAGYYNWDISNVKEKDGVLIGLLSSGNINNKLLVYFSLLHYFLNREEDVSLYELGLERRLTNYMDFSLSIKDFTSGSNMTFQYGLKFFY